jgi:hypothetical protein
MRLTAEPMIKNYLPLIEGLIEAFFFLESSVHFSQRQRRVSTSAQGNALGNRSHQ